MTDGSTDNLRINDFLARIERHTGHQQLIFERPLETGTAEKAGVTGFLIPFSITLTLALFSIANIPDEKMIQDLLAHARSARVTAAVLLLSDQREIFYQGERTGDL
ncbi:MAG: hypothetical protein V1862_05230, partial [Methanobacteriota archaeon]